MRLKLSTNTTYNPNSAHWNSSTTSVSFSLTVWLTSLSFVKAIGVWSWIRSISGYYNLITLLQKLDNNKRIGLVIRSGGLRRCSLRVRMGLRRRGRVGWRRNIKYMLLFNSWYKKLVLLLSESVISCLIHYFTNQSIISIVIEINQSIITIVIDINTLSLIKLNIKDAL